MLAEVPTNRGSTIIDTDKQVKTVMKMKTRIRRPVVATIDEGGVLEDSCEAPQKVVRTSSFFSQRTRSKSPKRDTDSSTTTTTGTIESPTPMNEKKGKRVHWHNKVEKKRHPRIQDLSKAERESIWYTESDTKIILAMAKVTVKMMMRGEPCDDIDYCSRGLEGKTPEGSKRRQRNKLRVRQALLEEQEIQREEGENDADYLGYLSVTLSTDVSAQAHNTALQDERDAQEIYYVPGDGILDVSPPQLPIRKLQK